MLPLSPFPPSRNRTPRIYTTGQRRRSMRLGGRRQMVEGVRPAGTTEQHPSYTVDNPCPGQAPSSSAPRNSLHPKTLSPSAPKLIGRLGYHSYPNPSKVTVVDTNKLLLKCVGQSKGPPTAETTREKNAVRSIILFYTRSRCLHIVIKTVWC